MKPCPHDAATLYRVVFLGGQHVRKLCPACGANVLGAGINVPFNKVPCDPRDLPVWKELKRVPEGEQKFLF